MEITTGKNALPVTRAAPSLNSLRGEDWDGDDSIPMAQAASYMRVYFDGGFDGNSSLTVPAVNKEALDPEMARDGTQRVWIEDSKTGDLMPTKMRHGGGAGNGAPDRGAEGWQACRGERGRRPHRIAAGPLHPHADGLDTALRRRSRMTADGGVDADHAPSDDPSWI